jgi:hypothetical protein
MRSEKFTDLAATVVIAAVGLGVAVVTFGVLQSSTTGNAGGYEVGGAIAGFLVSTAALGSFYLQQRKSSSELNALRAKNLELAQKLIRSVPRPEEWEIELDERQRIALARPKQWYPRGGVIFDFQDVSVPLAGVQSAPDSDDIYPAYFMLSYQSIDPSTKKGSATEDRDAFYAEQRALAEAAYKDGWIARPQHEFIHLGDESAPLKCLKTVTCSYYTVADVPDPLTGRVAPFFNQILAPEYEERVRLQTAAAPEQAAPVARTGDGSAVAVAPPPAAVPTEAPPGPADDSPAAAGDGSAPAPAPGPEKLVVLQRMVVTCYHRTLDKVFFFEIWDDDEDFAESSAVMDRLLHSTRFLV